MTCRHIFYHPLCQTKWSRPGESKLYQAENTNEFIVQWTKPNKTKMNGWSKYFLQILVTACKKVYWVLKSNQHNWENLSLFTKLPPRGDIFWESNWIFGAALRIALINVSKQEAWKSDQLLRDWKIRRCVQEYLYFCETQFWKSNKDVSPH